MRKMLFVASAAVLAIASPATAQQVVTTSTNANVTGGFTFGSGNDYVPANAVVTTTTTDGRLTDQLGVRFHNGSVAGAPASDPNGVYSFAFGTTPISFDFSIFGGTADANILLTNLLTGQTAFVNPLLLGGNSINGSGAIQNSEQLGFGFLNNSGPLAGCCGNLGFNANVDDTYRIDLSANGHVATAFARIGNGAAVPEPATWAMMLTGFAGIGLATRRSRRKQGTAKLAQIA